MDFQTEVIERVANIDDKQVRETVLDVIQDKAEPHLLEIKGRAEQAEDAEEVREIFENLPSESDLTDGQKAQDDVVSKDDVFHRTWAEFISSVAQLRLQPVEGYTHLKSMIRDPYTLEGMLLIMDQETIPEETKEAQKDLLASYIHYMGVAIAPEMYDREEVVEMIDMFGGDPALLLEFDRIMNNVDAPENMTPAQTEAYFAQAKKEMASTDSDDEETEGDGEAEAEQADVAND